MIMASNERQIEEDPSEQGSVAPEKQLYAEEESSGEESAVGEGSLLLEGSPTQASEPVPMSDRDPKDWDNAVLLNQTQFEATEKSIPIDQLRLDHKLKHGQTRTIDFEHSKKIQDSFLIRHPPGLLTALVWNDGSMLRHKYSGRYCHSRFHRRWILGPRPSALGACRPAVPS